jgi:hypothetical protein
MKQRKLLLLAGLLFLFMGCDNYYMICSLNQFYIEENITTFDSIEGSWTAKSLTPRNDSKSSSNWTHADTATTWTIKRFVSRETVKNNKGGDSVIFKPENYYTAKLTSISDSANYAFKVVLFKVKNNLYADFIPIDKEGLMKGLLITSSYFDVHTLARITINNNQIDLSWLGADCVKEMIEKKRVRINYLWVKQTNKFLLSATSGELTDMIERYGNQERFIDWENQKAQLSLISLK